MEKNKKNGHTEDGYSIVMTAYKAQDFIEECLDSIENQTHFQTNKNYEILLGIDGCEETLECVKSIKNKYTNLKVLFMKENKGTYVTKNTLILESRYDKILTFDSDDVMLHTMMDSINDVMKGSMYDVFRFRAFHFSGKLNIEKNYPPSGAHLEGVTCMRWKVYDKVGGYRPWRCAADSDFMFRMIGLFKEKVLDTSLYYRRIHKDSLTQSAETGFRSDIRKKYASQLKRKFEHVNFTCNSFEYVEDNNNKTESSTMETVDKDKTDDISVILNVYKRSYTLKQQVESILNQTVNIKEENIHIWYNRPEDGSEQLILEEYPKIKTYICNYNTKFFGRFTIPLLCRTKYIAMFDDDIIPGVKWFENCITEISKQDGIYGGSGIITNGKIYSPHEKVGWNGTKREVSTKVDLVGHSWFFKQEYAKFMWTEPIPSWDNGEDIFFSYIAQKNGIDTFVPPHPNNDNALWSNVSGEKYGNDKNAHWLTNKNHMQDRNELVKEMIERGWKTVR